MKPWHHRGPVYKAAFSATALSTAGATDVFCLTAPIDSRVAVREITLGQYSDAGDAEAEILSVTALLGSTAESGGSALTPYNVQRHTGRSTAGADVLGPSTTVASTASAVVVLADIFNVAGGWTYRPDEGEQIHISPEQLFVVKVSNPADALTLNGTLTFSEIGTVVGGPHVGSVSTGGNVEFLLDENGDPLYDEDGEHLYVD